MKETLQIIGVYFQLKWDALRLFTAIKMADALQKAKNKRFYVIENAQGKLIWLCNDDIKIMKRPRKVRKLINGKIVTRKFYMIPPKTTHLDIMRDCLYYTPTSRNNTDGLSRAERMEKQQSWLKYLEEKRMNSIFGKRKIKR